MTAKLIHHLQGHEDRAWHLAWNPSRSLVATCSSDKSVRLYSYRRSPDGAEGSPSLEFRTADVIPTGHSKTVRSIAWSPSGENLATASFDSTVAIFSRSENRDDETASGEWECVSTLEGHESECKSVGYSCTGTLLASCSRDKSVWIWEVQPDADFECMSVLMEHTQDVKCLAWHPKEEILASASYDDTIKLYIDDPEDDWYPFTTLSGHTSTVWSLSFSPCGNYLASCSDDRSLKIWHRKPRSAPKNAPGGIGVGAGSSVENWICELTIPNAHDRPIYSVSFTHSRRKGMIEAEVKEIGWLASAGSDEKVNVWSILVGPAYLVNLGTAYLTTSTGNNSCRARFDRNVVSTHYVGDINAVAWCPREGFQDLLGTVGDDGSLSIWSIVENETGMPLNPLSSR
ncbi:WD40-repeat-containing domain protein [Cantharellus anzutake]|uniref:WD40-repeat-containing domain protein n=1 Tax=Cantharellus anzutake TaxID=1750568 RepID=UPI001908EEDA|nr:WD40-repeat-containing domain protein [Cantharellus anzutake]KAF8325780.1 WD40-repeat-containing domain protein [Cantharellus anzutake]